MKPASLNDFWGEVNYLQSRQPGREKNLAHLHKQRARKMGAVGEWSGGEWLALRAAYHDACVACGATRTALVPDHIVPLKHGGDNTIGNIQPLCVSCNAHKGVKTIDYRLNPHPLRPSPQALRLADIAHLFESKRGTLCREYAYLFN